MPALCCSKTSSAWHICGASGSLKRNVIVVSAAIAPPATRQAKAAAARHPIPRCASFDSPRRSCPTKCHAPIPRQTGEGRCPLQEWIPACAGMTTLARLASHSQSAPPGRGSSQNFLPSDLHDAAGTQFLHLRLADPEPAEDFGVVLSELWGD